MGTLWKGIVVSALILVSVVSPSGCRGDAAPETPAPAEATLDASEWHARFEAEQARSRQLAEQCRLLTELTLACIP